MNQQATSSSSHDSVYNSFAVSHFLPNLMEPLDSLDSAAGAGGGAGHSLKLCLGSQPSPVIHWGSCSVPTHGPCVAVSCRLSLVAWALHTALILTPIATSFLSGQASDSSKRSTAKNTLCTRCCTSKFTLSNVSHWTDAPPPYSYQTFTLPCLEISEPWDSVAAQGGGRSALSALNASCSFLIPPEPLLALWTLRKMAHPFLCWHLPLSGTLWNPYLLLRLLSSQDRRWSTPGWCVLLCWFTSWLLWFALHKFAVCLTKQRALPGSVYLQSS